jgi:hypothetical protein
MKRIKYNISIYLSLFSFSILICNAQQPDLYANYEKALQLYNFGMADSALSVIKACIKSRKELNKISPDISANIFRLAALSSIMTGNPTDAEAYVKKMVTFRPDYKNHFREDDLLEFRLMVSKTTSQPSFRLGITGGLNVPFVSVQKQFSDYGSPSDQYSISGNAGYQFYLTAEQAFTKNISAEVSAGITQILFKYVKSEQAVTQNQYDQSITYIEIPVICRYSFFHDKTFKPYLEGGVACRFPLYPREYSNDYGKYWFTQSSNSDKILTTFETDVENIGLVLGGGAGYDLKNISLRFGLRYYYNFKSSGKSSKFDEITGFDDIPSSEKFHYTDDINLINLKYLQISVGILYNLRYKVF